MPLFMSLKIRVKNPIKFRIFEIYFACIEFCEFAQNLRNSRKFVFAKISMLKVIET